MNKDPKILSFPSKTKILEKKSQKKTKKWERLVGETVLRVPISLKKELDKF